MLTDMMLWCVYRKWPARLERWRAPRHDGIHQHADGCYDLVTELVTVRKHMESMRDKTDWLPSKHGDEDESKPPKPSTGLLNKLF